MQDEGFNFSSEDNKKSQQIKSNEITGERYIFHSLPKELQDMSNVYFVQELHAQGSADKNLISKANLNNYKWLCIKDAFKFAHVIALAVITSAIWGKAFTSLSGFIIGVLTFLPVLAYVSYHVVFYAVIRAQEIGNITRSIANYTSKVFYLALFVFTTIMCFSFMVVVALANKIMVYFYKGLLWLNARSSNGIIDWCLDKAIIAHNFFMEVFFYDNTIWNNIYTQTLLMGIIALVTMVWFEYRNYISHRADAIKQYILAGLNLAFPIETAQLVMTSWRDNNEKKQVGKYNQTTTLLEKSIKGQ